MIPARFHAMLLATVFAATTASAEEWQALFNGKDLGGWTTFLAKPDPAWDVPGLSRDEKGKYLEPIGKDRDPLKVFVVEKVDGKPAIHVSGQGFGVMTTTRSFTNFHLRMQVKWGEKKWGSRANAVRDCGLLYFVHGDAGFDHETWPRSIEFQIQEHDMGDLYALGAQTTVTARRVEGTNGKATYVYDPKAEPMLFTQKPPVGNRCVKLLDAEKPNGQWNTLDLVCIGGDSIHIVNGKIAMRLRGAQRLDGAQPQALAGGQISLQVEGAEVFYRNIEIREIAKVPWRWR